LDLNAGLCFFRLRFGSTGCFPSGLLPILTYIVPPIALS
jgi:hypothetical protein